MIGMRSDFVHGLFSDVVHAVPCVIVWVAWQILVVWHVLLARFSLFLLGGGYMGNWKYQAGCGEVGVTSTLCNTCQFAALRNGLCTKWQFCSASVRLPCLLQCTGWQFCWCQCQHSVFFAMHLAGSASDGSSVPSNTSGTVVGAKLPLLAQQHLFIDTFTQNWTAAMQPGILCNEKQKRHKTEGPRPKPLVVQ